MRPIRLPDSPQFRKSLHLILLILIFFDFSITAWHFLRLNRYSGSFQGYTLGEAIKVKEGTYRYNGNENPFYFAALSPFSKRSVEFFTHAKILSFGLIFLTLLCFFFICRDLAGFPSGILGIFWMASNWVVVALAFHLRTEVFLLGFFLVAWWAVIKGFKNPRWWILGGIFSGLAYQSKGTGQLLLVALILTIPFIFRKNWKSYLNLGYFLVFYILLASPLWILNFKMFGDPFYNWSIRHAMWLDSWDQLEQISQFPTLGSVVAQYGLAGILARLFKGMGSFFPIFFSIFIPHKIFFPHAVLFWPWVGFAAGGLIFAFVNCKEKLIQGIKKYRELIIFSTILTLHRLLGAPFPPLVAVDGPQVSVFIGPLVPNGDVILMKIFHIGIPVKKPQQLMDDGPHMALFGGDQGKPG